MEPVNKITMILSLLIGSSIVLMIVSYIFRRCRRLCRGEVKPNPYPPLIPLDYTKSILDIPPPIVFPLFKRLMEDRGGFPVRIQDVEQRPEILQGREQMVERNSDDISTVFPHLCSEGEGPGPTWGAQERQGIGKFWKR